MLLYTAIRDFADVIKGLEMKKLCLHYPDGPDVILRVLENQKKQSRYTRERKMLHCWM